MAKVIVRVVGQNPREVEAGTVGELKRNLGLNNYTASINREPASDGDVLEDDDLVLLAPSVKGG